MSNKECFLADFRAGGTAICHPVEGIRNNCQCCQAKTLMSRAAGARGAGPGRSGGLTTVYNLIKWGNFFFREHFVSSGSISMRPRNLTKWRTVPFVISNNTNMSQRWNIGNRIFSPLPTQIQQKQILGAFLKKENTKTSNYRLGQWEETDGHKESEASHKP